MLCRGPFTAGVSRGLEAAPELAVLRSPSLSSVAHPEDCLTFIPLLVAWPVLASLPALHASF